MASFSTLPSELKDIIWNISIATIPSRIVQLISSPPHDSSNSNERFCTSIAPIPPLLHACTRSRQLSSKRWQCTFREAYGRHNPSSPPSPSHGIGKVWFDPKTDILLLLDYWHAGMPPNSYMDSYNVGFRYDVGFSSPYSPISVFSASCLNLIDRKNVTSLAISLDDVNYRETASDSHSSDEESMFVGDIFEMFPGVTHMYFLCDVLDGENEEYSMVGLQNGETLMLEHLYGWYTEQLTRIYKMEGGIDLHFERFVLSRKGDMEMRGSM